MGIQKKHGLEIEEEAYHFPRSYLIYQIISWIILFAVVIGALLGLMGQEGVLGWTAINDPQKTTHIEYDRFLRKDGDSHLKVLVYPRSTADKLVQIKINTAYLQKMQIHEISPKSIMEQSDQKFTSYFFYRDQNKPVEIMFFFEPYKAGLAYAELIVNQNRVKFTQFVYP